MITKNGLKPKNWTIRAVFSVVIVILLVAILLQYTEFPHGRWSTSVLRFGNPQENELYSASGETLTVWNTLTGKIKNEITFNSSISAIDVSISNETAVGKKNGEIDILNSKTLSKIVTLVQDKNVTDLEFSKSGNILVSADSLGNLYLWENNTLVNKSNLHAKDVLSVSISSDGKYIASSSLDNTLIVIERENLSHRLLTENYGNDWVSDLEWRPNSNLLATVTHNGTVKVYDIDQNKTVFYENVSVAVNLVKWSPDGKYIYVTGGYNYITSWNFETGAVRFSKELEDAEELVPICVSEDGEIATTLGSSSNIRIWNINGERINSLPDRSVPPIFYIVTLTAIALSVVLIVEAESYYKKDFANRKLLYGRRGLSFIVKFYLFVLCNYGGFAYSYFMEFFISSGSIGGVLTMSLIVNAIMAILFVLFSFSYPTSAWLDENGIYTGVSWVDQYIKKKRAFIEYSDVQSVHPTYSYTKQENEFKKSALEISTRAGETYTVGRELRPNYVEEIESILSGKIGANWSKIYDQAPNINTQRWLKLRKYATKSFTRMIIETILIMSAPYLLISVFVLFDILLLLLSVGGFFAFIFVAVFLALSLMLAMLCGMVRMRRYNEALSIYRMIQLHNKMRPENVYPIDITSKDKYDAEDFLKVDEKQWMKYLRIQKGDKVTTRIAMVGLALFFIGIALSRSEEIESDILQITTLVFLIASPILFVFFFKNGFEIQRTRAVIKRAVEYEIKTGRRILPENYEIPYSGWATNFIFREKTELTPEEKKLAEKTYLENPLWTVLLGASILLMIIISFMVLNVLKVSGTMGFLTFMAFIFIPTFIVVKIGYKRTKAIAKLRAIEEYERLLKERRTT